MKCGHPKDSLRQRRQGFGKHEGPRKGREGRARATLAVLEKDCSSRKSLLPQSLRNLSKPIRPKEKAMPFSPAIEACRVPDERLAGAYEETSTAHRSWIKTTLALAEATYPAPPSRLTITSENAAAGFGFARTRETAPWAVLLIGEGYASAVRLAAAIMPARLAGVEPVFRRLDGCGNSPVRPVRRAGAHRSGTGLCHAGSGPAPARTSRTRAYPALRESPLFRNVPVPSGVTEPHASNTPPCPTRRFCGPTRTPCPPMTALTSFMPARLSSEKTRRLSSGRDWKAAGCTPVLTPDFFMNERLALSALKLES